MAPPSAGPTPAEASASLDRIMEMSNILRTGLNRNTLGLLVALCNEGVSPDALAEIVRFLRRESEEDANDFRVLATVAGSRE